MSIESVIKDLKNLIKGSDEIRITGAAGKRAMLDDNTPSVIQVESTGQNGKFKLTLVSPKGTTNLGEVASDIDLSPEDLDKIKEMNEKGLKGYQSQVN